MSAMSLLMILLKHDDAGSAANLFYLATPLVAFKAWVLFYEPMTKLSVLGMFFCILGVFVVNFSSENPEVFSKALHFG